MEMPDATKISSSARETISKMLGQLDKDIANLGKQEPVTAESLGSIKRVISHIEELHGFIKPRAKTIGAKKQELSSTIMKPIEILFNMATTIRDAAESGDNTKKLVAQFRKASVQPRELLEEALTKLEDRKVEEAAQMTLQQMMQNDAASVAKYASYKNKLPKESGVEKHGYTFCILPALPMLSVVPILPPISQAEYDQVGFETGTISGYPVFENQTMIAISRVYAQDNKVKTKDILETALKSMKLKGKHYMLVCDKPAGNAKTPTLEYYWIMEDSQLRHLQTLKGRQIFAKDWDFPF